MKQIWKRFGSVLYYLVVIGIVWGVFYAGRSCNEDTSKFVYRQDKRTRMCYAFSWWRTSFARVPCDKIPSKYLDR